MPRSTKAVVFVAVLALNAGCGGVIGQFDSLPAVEVPEETPWPQLVDTPTPPEDRLTAGTGGAALSRLNEDRTASAERQQRAEQIAPVSDSLTDRVVVARSRSEAPRSVVDGDLLASRAALSQQKSSRPSTSGNAARLPGRRTRPSTGPVLSADFDERARRALERAAQGTNP